MAILFVSLALAAMCVLGCLPHHHHGDSVCFGLEHIELADNHSHDCSDEHQHAEECCHTTENGHHGAGEDDCSLVEMFHKVLAASEVRGDVPCVEVALPEWQESMCECLVESCCTHHGYCHLVPTPYESPCLGVRALRAPPCMG